MILPMLAAPFARAGGDADDFWNAYNAWDKKNGQILALKIHAARAPVPPKGEAEEEGAAPAVQRH